MHQPELFAGDLRVIERHALETAAGKHSLADFAEFYCLCESGPSPWTESDFSCPL